LGHLCQQATLGQIALNVIGGVVAGRRMDAGNTAKDEEGTLEHRRHSSLFEIQVEIEEFNITY